VCANSVIFLLESHIRNSSRIGIYAEGYARTEQYIDGMVVIFETRSRLDVAARADLKMDLLTPQVFHENRVFRTADAMSYP
jgi:hypothetical protein